MLFGNFSLIDGFLKALITPWMCLFNFIGCPLCPVNNCESSVKCSSTLSISCNAPDFSAPNKIEDGSPFLILQCLVNAVSILSNTSGLLFMIASCTAYSKQIPQSPSPLRYKRANFHNDILSYPPSSVTISRFKESKIPFKIGEITAARASTSD